MPAHTPRSSISRRALLAGAGLGAAAYATRRLYAAPARPPGKPNLVLIVADDLGYGELGCYGGTQIPTPHLDALAAQGVRLTNGYVSCPVCSPTRAGFLSGRYQQRFGHEFNPGPAEAAAANFGISPDEKLISERLKELGYVTGMVGKWHLGYRDGFYPTDRGFDEFYGFLGGAHAYLPNAAGGQRGGILRGKNEVDPPEYLTDALAAEAASFIDRHREEPFFLYLPFNAVHTPLHATEKYLARFAGIADPKRRTFAAMLSAMDDAVGTVTAKLHEAGLDENTLVIFHSDNGGPTAATTCLNTPLRGAKGQVYEGGIRVPFIVRWTGRLPAGTTYDRPVIALDDHPTLVAAAGGTPAANLEGVNLLPYLDGTNAAAPHESLYWRAGANWAIRQGDWKLLSQQSPARELYHLAQDIGETNNLAAQQAERVRALQAAYDAWDRDNIEPRWGRQGAAAGAGGGQNRQRRQQRQGRRANP